MEYYSVFRKKELLIYIAMMNYEDIILRSQAENIKYYYMILPI